MFCVAVFDFFFNFFSMYPVIQEPSLATYHYVIQLFYQHGMYVGYVILTSVDIRLTLLI